MRAIDNGELQKNYSKYTCKYGMNQKLKFILIHVFFFSIFFQDGAVDKVD